MGKDRKQDHPFEQRDRDDAANAMASQVQSSATGSSATPIRGDTRRRRTATQSRKEQVDTLIHETGHTFGLRHFFALSESAWPSVISGTHRPFSIMNYGSNSELTGLDKADLTTLYRQAWDGELTHINGTPIRLVRPFSSLAPVPDGVFALGRQPVG